MKLSYLWTKLLGSCIELSNRVSYDVIIHPIYFHVLLYWYLKREFLPLSYLFFSISHLHSLIISRNIFFTLFLNCVRQNSNDENFEFIEMRIKNVQDVEINILIVTFLVLRDNFWNSRIFFCFSYLLSSTIWILPFSQEKKNFATFCMTQKNYSKRKKRRNFS